MPSREEVYSALDSERDYQQSRAAEAHPEHPEEHIHSVNDYVVYMDDYMNELKHQLSRIWVPEGQIPEALNTLRKITALGVAAMEQNGAPLRWCAKGPDGKIIH